MSNVRQTKMSQQNSTPRLPIDSCEALFQKLKWDYIQLEKDWSSTYCAFNFVVTAYHLYQDWLPSAGSAEQKERRAALPDKGKLLFKVLRDITNATKHWELHARSQSQQVVSSVSTPQIGDWYAYLIAGPVSYVQVGDSRPSIIELAGVTIRCLKWLIEGEQSFPLNDLSRQLEIVFSPLAQSSG
jgi:hypothetical protein